MRRIKTEGVRGREGEGEKEGKALFSGEAPMSVNFIIRINETTKIEELGKELAELEKLVEELKDPTSKDEATRRVRYIKWRLEVLKFA